MEELLIQLSQLILLNLLILLIQSNLQTLLSLRIQVVIIKHIVLAHSIKVAT